MREKTFTKLVIIESHLKKLSSRNLAPTSTIGSLVMGGPGDEAILSV